MSNAVFPVLIGASYPAVRTPVFATRIHGGVGGREVRIADYPYPRWKFSLPYNYLPLADWQTLLGFFLQRQGAWDTFLFDDTSDDSVTGQAIGTGNASQTAFQLLRTLGGFSEAVLAPNTVSNVYLNGVAQSPSSYSVNAATGVVTFTTAPGSGVAVTADFSFYFRCRFAQDSADFEQFVHRIWRQRAIKFVSVFV
jgi:uncharacterized protein (TIGR02217 family)